MRVRYVSFKARENELLTLHGRLVGEDALHWHILEVPFVGKEPMATRGPKLSLPKAAWAAFALVEREEPG
jgi:hypothetical protein